MRVNAKSGREAGFSLLELLVVIAILMVAAAVGAVIIATVRRTVDLAGAATLAENAIKHKVNEATKGSRTEFRVSRDLPISGDQFVVNPQDIPPPAGTTPCTEITFQGPLGDAYVNGSKTRAAVVIARAGSSSEAYALVVGSSGRVETKRRVDGRWEDVE